MTKQLDVHIYSASRKTSRASALIKPGKGVVRINRLPLELFMPEVARERIRTVLVLAPEYADKVDIEVRMKGGGFMGQAEAAAIAIARALVGFTKDKKLMKRIIEFDRHLLVGDPRRKEPKKFGGPGARRRKQKSYR